MEFGLTTPWKPPSDGDADESDTGVVPPEDPDYDRALINRLYDVRTNYVKAHHYPVSPNRYPSERRDALRMASE